MTVLRTCVCVCVSVCVCFDKLTYQGMSTAAIEKLATIV